MNERVVLITGALTGIGRATATAFARQGAAVVVSGRRDEEGKALAAELRELGAEAEYIRADVSIEDDVQALVDGTVKTFGQLDVAVNNAGVTGHRGELTAQTLEAYNAVFDTNVRGVFFSLKHELRVMTAQGSGSIVNLSSTFGERGGAGAALYSASKHAVKRLHPVRGDRGGRHGHPRQRRRPRAGGHRRPRALRGQPGARRRHGGNRPSRPPRQRRRLRGRHHVPRLRRRPLRKRPGRRR